MGASGVVESTADYKFIPCGIFMAPGIDTGLKGPSVFSERLGQSSC